MRRHFSHNMAQAFKAANITAEDIAWFQHRKGRKFAPLPDCKLRKLAIRAGFRSSAEFLAAERAKRSRHAAAQ
jgi:hypothetical protein